MINPIKNEKIYQIIMEQIKEMVKNGELKKGDKLPSERLLAEKLEVSRSSVREALKSLSILGLVESKHGEGNYIKSNFEDSLLEPLSIVFLLIGGLNEEIFQLRRIVEPEAAAIAAKNINQSELAELLCILEEMENCEEVEEAVALDRKFHYNIVKAAGNNLISTIMFSVSLLIEKYIGNSQIHNINKEIVESQHREIYNALEKHDSTLACNILKKHLKLCEF